MANRMIINVYADVLEIEDLQKLPEHDWIEVLSISRASTGNYWRRGCITYHIKPKHYPELIKKLKVLTRGDGINLTLIHTEEELECPITSAI